MPTPYYHDKASGIRLFLGDCRDVLPTLACAPKLVLTDPPYKTGDSPVDYAWDGVSKRVTPTVSVGMPWGYPSEWVDLAARLAPQHWVVFANFLMLGDVHAGLAQHGKVSAVFVWRKANAPRMSRPVPRLDCEFIVWARSDVATCVRMGEFQSLVLDVPMPQAGCMADERILEKGSGRAAHPCQKPLAIVAPFLGRICDVGDLVLDPFTGTGTTLVAAKEAGCHAIGIEQSEVFAEIAARRLEQGILSFTE